MKDNKEILNEAFFKKASYDEKLAKRLPQYAPLDPKQPVRSDLSPFASLSSYQVTDTDEVKKRLAGTYGVAFGNNNIKNMASKALKTFPILVSDNIEPETAIMLKKLVEEQYAEYVNLLISNQVINLADYSTDETNGNVAIQALDTISGMDYAKSRVANKAARTDSIEVGDVFANVPLYNLLRESEFKIDTGDEITNALLEDAVVVPSEETDTFIEFFKQYANEIAVLNEYKLTDRDTARVSDTYRLEDEMKDGKPTGKKIQVPNKTYDPNDMFYGYNKEYQPGTGEYWFDRDQREKIKDVAVDTIRGFGGLDSEGEEIYRKLSTGDVVLDQDRFDQAINRTVGEFLALPENRNIRERFELATFLLQSKRIAGVEYYNYLTMRLGIPVSDKARQELMLKYKIGDIRDYGREVSSSDEKKLKKSGYADDKNNNTIYSIYSLSKEDQEAIAHNRKRVGKLVNDITKYNIKEVLGHAALISGGIVGTGAAISAAVYAAKTPTSLAIPGTFWAKLWSALSFGKTGALGGLIGGAVISAILAGIVGGGYALIRLIAKIRKRRAEKIAAGMHAAYQARKIEGWERVEKLINDILRQREEVKSGKYIDTEVTRVYGELNNKDAASEHIKELELRSSRDLKSTDISGSELKRSVERFDNASSEEDKYKYYTNNAGETIPRKIIAVNKSDIRKEVEDQVKAANKLLDDETKGYRRIFTEAYLTEEEAKEEKVSFSNFIKDYEESSKPTDEDVAEVNACIDCVNEELAADKDYQAELLSEKVLAKTRIPMEVKYVEKNPEKDILLRPELGPRTMYAFGSTEIERKENKDRKYNQPLIMTIKFRERFSDGKIGDNELTAVIGILGKIIRIPTEEMEYVLKESVNGNTIEGVFKTGNLGDSIEDMLSTSKVSKDLKNLQRSADIWHNLEKVTTLALANKISGKRNNNISNAHIIFSQREVDAVRTDTGVDIIRDVKKAVALMKRYSAFTLMIANDAGQRVYILDDQDDISWDVLPYNAIIGKDSGDQLNAALTKLMRH